MGLVMSHTRGNLRPSRTRHPFATAVDRSSWSRASRARRACQVRANMAAAGPNAAAAASRRQSLTPAAFNMAGTATSKAPATASNDSRSNWRRPIKLRATHLLPDARLRRPRERKDGCPQGVAPSATKCPDVRPSNSVSWSLDIQAIELTAEGCREPLAHRLPTERRPAGADRLAKRSDRPDLARLRWLAVSQAACITEGLESPTITGRYHVDRRLDGTAGAY